MTLAMNKYLLAIIGNYRQYDRLLSIGNVPMAVPQSLGPVPYTVRVGWM